jgi:hypothetical protein
VPHLVWHPISCALDLGFLADGAERPADVALAQRAADLGAEHQVVVLPPRASRKPLSGLHGTVPPQGVDGELGQAQAALTSSSLRATATAQGPGNVDARLVTVEVVQASMFR